MHGNGRGPEREVLDCMSVSKGDNETASAAARLQLHMERLNQKKWRVARESRENLFHRM